MLFKEKCREREFILFMLLSKNSDKKRNLSISADFKKISTIQVLIADFKTFQARRFQPISFLPTSSINRDATIITKQDEQNEDQSLQECSLKFSLSFCNLSHFKNIFTCIHLFVVSNFILKFNSIIKV